MKNKSIKILAVIAVLVIIVFSITVFGFAQTQYGYQISDYEVEVNILDNGDLAVSERVKYSFLGNSNNAVILIDKQDGEEIEIKKVYTLIKDKLIECEQLSAGQWDANVFNGTYSVLQENNLVRLKVYSNFKKQQGTVIVHYIVKNAVKRYRDIALLDRTFILEDWNGYASNIDIEIKLPRYTDAANIRPYLHGVLVGQKDVTNGRTIKYSIPNTVPGEYVEVRVVFPEDLIKNAQLTAPRNYMRMVLEEEKEYSESDKSHLLKARENAAKEAGKRAWNEKMTQRRKLFLSIVSIFTSVASLLIIRRAYKELHINQETESFELKDIPKLTPQEACLLLSGKIGARGVLAGLFSLASKGFVEPVFITEENISGISFQISENQNTEHLEESERYLLQLIREYSDEHGKFEIIRNIAGFSDTEEKEIIKEKYLNFVGKIQSDYSEKNKLTSNQLYYRNLGLILGVVLFIAGCIISVAYSVLSAYLMLPVGFFVFWYSLNIQRKTPYSIKRIKALMELRKLICKTDKKDKTLPDWLNDTNRLIGYSIAIRAENKLHLIEKTLLGKDIKIIKKTLKKSLAALYDSLSAILDN
ncbi:MAG: DUF2207 domain-containing protein [Clostridiaceae bacterium]|nr:DUF2207 domain-containing protein [Clostridiaceae bacterium]